jgi:hypothetical protein
MQKLILVSAVFFLAFHVCAYAQNASYDSLIGEASKLYDAKDYLRSGQTYTKAFNANGGMGIVNDRYDAACSWAQAGNADSSFSQLFRIARKGNFTNLNHLMVDADLESLHSDKRWDEVTALVKQNKDKAEVNFNKPLVAVLDTILQDDQSGRMQLDAVEKKYGRDSKEMKAHWAMIEQKDSIDLVRIKDILDQYGWLGPDVIGREGNQTLFLVIQHADIETQQHYLPMMREAVKNKKAQPSSLALLEDRVALRIGKRQVYGSQIGRYDDGRYYVSPLEDPDNVDKRRAEVGLGPLANYVRNWQMEWNVAE